MIVTFFDQMSRRLDLEEERKERARRQEPFFSKAGRCALKTKKISFTFPSTSLHFQLYFPSSPHFHFSTPHFLAQHQMSTKRLYQRHKRVLRRELFGEIPGSKRALQQEAYEANKKRRLEHEQLQQDNLFSQETMAAPKASIWPQASMVALKPSMWTNFEDVPTYNPATGHHGWQGIPVCSALPSFPYKHH